ncbi:glycine betaine ABC transporter substrate-binding protein [Candidatus Nitrospira bockiana]
MGRTHVFAAVILLAGLLGCSDKDRPIIVGSKNFMEQIVLGEIVAQHLEHRLGRTVERKLNLGGTMLAHQALVKGEIDLYPEYTGTALTAVLNLPPSADPADVLTRVRHEYERRFGVRWLDPLGFNNTFAMVIRREDAERHRVDSLSDAARYRPGWTLGVGYEFQQRPDGLATLLETYRLPLTGPPKTMDLGLLYRALEQRQVSMVAGNSTDGLLSVLDVTVLRDDRRCFPPYEAAIAVRLESLEREPGLAAALNELAGQFTDETMRRLNHQATVQHGRVQDLAKAFLTERGLRP